jgi:hypothetical protein
MIVRAISCPGVPVIVTPALVDRPETGALRRWRRYSLALYSAAAPRQRCGLLAVSPSLPAARRVSKY